MLNRHGLRLKDSDRRCTYLNCQDIDNGHLYSLPFLVLYRLAHLPDPGLGRSCCTGGRWLALPVKIFVGNATAYRQGKQLDAPLSIC